MGSEEPAFAVEEVNTGTHANGFGHTDDGRSFAFRVTRSTLYLEIYRIDVSSPVPDKSEVEAVAEHSVTEVDLTDERSIIGAVRDAVGHAEDVTDASRAQTTAVRAFLSRVGSVFDGP